MTYNKGDSLVFKQDFRTPHSERGAVANAGDMAIVSDVGGSPAEMNEWLDLEIYPTGLTPGENAIMKDRFLLISPDAIGNATVKVNPMQVETVAAQYRRSATRFATYRPGETFVTAAFVTVYQADGTKVDLRPGERLEVIKDNPTSVSLNFGGIPVTAKKTDLEGGKLAMTRMIVKDKQTGSYPTHISDVLADLAATGFDSPFTHGLEPEEVDWYFNTPEAPNHWIWKRSARAKRPSRRSVSAALIKREYRKTLRERRDDGVSASRIKRIAARKLGAERGAGDSVVIDGTEVIAWIDTNSQTVNRLT